MAKLDLSIVKTSHIKTSLCSLQLDSGTLVALCKNLICLPKLLKKNHGFNESSIVLLLADPLRLSHLGKSLRSP